MVEEVEYGTAGAHLELPLAQMKCERPGDLQVGGRELSGTALYCVDPMIFAIVILYRPRETGMNIEHRRDGQLPRSLQCPPRRGIC